MQKAKLIGGIFIVSGTAIGAGMLALPLVSAAVGVPIAVFAVICVWLLMTTTGLLVLEVNLALPSFHNSFSSMAKATIGRGAQVIAWLSCLLLLYSLTGAYISGSSSTLGVLLQYFFHWSMPYWLCALIFTLVLGSVVWLGTSAVDLVNRGVMSLKLAVLVVVLAGMLPKIKWAYFISVHLSGVAVLAMMPIILTSFGYHTVIPTLRNYFDSDPKTIRMVIILGSLLPMLVYLLWLAATLGMIPQHGDYSIDFLRQENFHLSSLIQSISYVSHSQWISVMIDLFANIAVITSFLGVSIGLLDFLADGTNRPNTRHGRLQSALLTFVPPLIFAYIYPHGFIIALGYAAIFVTILEIILPAWMVFYLRANPKLSSPYRVRGGKGLLYLVIVIGFLFLMVEVFNTIHGLK